MAFLAGAGMGLLATAWMARGYVRPDWRPYARVVVEGLAAGGIAAAFVYWTGAVLWSAFAGAALFAAAFYGLTWSTDRDLIRLAWRLGRTAIGASAGVLGG